MIGRLRGTLLEKQAPEIVVDVNGLGYEVLVPMSTLFALPGIGQELSLYTHFIVREDAQQLYGFADRTTRRLFRDLIKVNGVGPKLALTILSGIDAEDFVRCVHDGDTGSLVRLPGVGKKTAERLIVEMKDRLSDWQLASGAMAAAPGAAAGSAVADAEAALIALGYKPPEASRAVAQVKAEGADSETLIRAALKNMVKS